MLRVIHKNVKRLWGRFYAGDKKNVTRPLNITRELNKLLVIIIVISYLVL